MNGCQCGDYCLWCQADEHAQAAAGATASKAPEKSEAARLDKMAAEASRLSAQCQKILARLREGPATYVQLSAMALKYTGRISDLRKAGHHIEVLSRDYASGLVTYHLLA